nr:transposon TX1 [Tanacetum cinerariifolium]
MKHHKKQVNRDCKDEEGKRHEDKRIIEVEDKEINSEVISTSLVGEVKALCFLKKLLVLCEEQGLNKVEVKMLGGLEVMMVFDTVETANNVLKDINYEMRRGLYKLRRGDSFHGASGRLT